MGVTLAEGILRHISSYRIGVLPVIARVLFQDDNARALRALEELHSAGMISVAAYGRLSCYQLSTAGCRAIGVSEDRSKHLTALSASRCLGVLWFATMNRTGRTIIDPKDLPSDPPIPTGAPHIVERLPNETPRTYRVHVVAEDRDHRYPLAELRKVVEDIARTTKGRKRITHGKYCFALLVHTDEKRRQLLDVLAKRAPLAHNALLIVETVPTPATFTS